MNELEVEVGGWLRRRGLWLATAESCTGGLIGHRITEVAGSSDYYIGGVIAYSNGVKMSALGVPAGLLGMYGAVSREAVLAMADGVRAAIMVEAITAERLIGLAVTGIAGPGGGTLGKPVGLTWIGLRAADFQGAWRFTWTGDRGANKRESAREALQLLLEYLRGNPRASD